MTTPVLKLVPPFSKQGLQADVSRVLKQASESQFDTVIVFGYKDSTVRTLTSKIVDITRVLGALEIAKKDLL